MNQKKSMLKDKQKNNKWVHKSYYHFLGSDYE